MVRDRSRSPADVRGWGVALAILLACVALWASSRRGHEPTSPTEQTAQLTSAAQPGPDAVDRTPGSPEPSLARRSPVARRGPGSTPSDHARLSASLPTSERGWVAGLPALEARRPSRTVRGASSPNDTDTIVLPEARAPPAA